MNIAKVVGVAGLVAVVITGLVCATVLGIHGQAIPGGLWTVIGGAGGAIGGWLTQGLTNGK